MMFRWLVTVLVLWLPFNLTAATYFVDFTGGSDAAAGTSTGTAWKHCPGDSNASGVPLGITLNPGDIVQFRGGVIYVGTITIRNGIDYDGRTWNGSRSLHTTAYAPNTSAWQSGANTYRQNFKIHGFEIYEVGGYAAGNPVFSGAPGSITSSPTGNGIYLDSPVSGCQIYDNILRDLGHWRNVTENFNLNSLSGTGIQFRKGGTNNSVTSNLLYHVPIALGLHSTATHKAFSNTFHGNTISNHIRWLVDWSGDANGAAFKSNRIHGNYIGDYSEYEAGNWLGSESGGNPHTDGIIIRCNGSTSQEWTNNVVDANHFWTDAPGNGVGGTASIFVTQGPHVDIFNNTFANPNHPFGISIGHNNTLTAQQRVRIINNTFKQSRIRDGTETSASDRRVYIQGNIFYYTGNTAVLLIEQNYLKLAALDGNLYFNTSVAQGTWNVAWLDGIDTSSKFADLQNYGFEGDGSYGNPLFTDATTPYRDVDFTVQEGSAAVGFGLNLTNIVRVDRNNVSRVGKTLTIGAFVFGTTNIVMDTNAPVFASTNIWVVDPHIIAFGMVSMTWTNAVDDSGDPVVYTVVESTGNPGCSGTSSQIETSFIDSEIPPDTTCMYAVYATDQAGNSTTLSDAKSVTTPTIPPDTQADVLNAVVGNLTIVNLTETNRFYLHAEGIGPQPRFVDAGSATNWDWSQEALAGTNGFNAGDSTNFSYTLVSFDSCTNGTIIGAIRRNASSTTKRQIGALLDNGVEKMAWYLGSNGLAFTMGSASNQIATHLPHDNWWRYRLIWQLGTGTDGFIYAKVGPDLQFSIAPSNSLTTGTSTGLVNQAQFGHTNGLPGNRFVFDETWMRATTNSITEDFPVPGDPELPP